MLFLPIFINKQDLARISNTDVTPKVYYPLLKSFAQNIPKCVSRMSVGWHRRRGGTALPSPACSPLALGPCPKLTEVWTNRRCQSSSFILSLDLRNTYTFKETTSYYGVTAGCWRCVWFVDVGKGGLESKS